MLRKILLLIILLGQLQFLAAQSFWIGSQNDQLLRIISLQDSSPVQHSMMIRPIQPDTLQNNNSIQNQWLQGNKTLVKKKLFTLNALPLDWVNQYNTHHPYGWNDGPMIGAKGYQTLVRTGIQFQSKYLDIQLAPELVIANNKQFEFFQNYGAKTQNGFRNTYLGQSSINLKVGRTYFGISTKNIWWGPGVSNSLVMSNNAPGFLHFTFASRKPLLTQIGKFEWQLIGGKLSSKDALLYEQNNNQGLEFGSSKSRYINAYIIVFTPNFFENNLSVGFIRSMQQLLSVSGNKDKGFFDRYLPVLPSPVQKVNNPGEDTANRDQLASLFMRLKFPAASAELYAEYGYTDYKLNVRDYVLNTIHSSAYIVGFRKIFETMKGKSFLFEFELTSMNESPLLLVREAGPWYRHWQLADGYTNNNQIIGAGAGYGVNMASFRVKQLLSEIRMELSYDNIKRRPEWNKPRWVDRSLGINFYRRVQNKLDITLQSNFVFSKNYAWENHTNRFNLFARLGLTYLW